MQTDAISRALTGTAIVYYRDRVRSLADRKFGVRGEFLVRCQAFYRGGAVATG